MQGIESSFATCSGITLHYYRRPGRGKRVLLIHGVSDDGSCWMPFLPSLPRDWDVLMPDLRGHGLSDAPDPKGAGGTWTAASMADEMTELCGKSKFTSPAIAGCSLGGAVALLTAALHPELPTALFLEDPVPFWNAPEPLPPDAGAGLYAWLASLKRKTGSDLLKEAESNDPSWKKAEFGPWIDSKHRMSDRVIGMAVDARLFPRSLRSVIPGIRCPLFLITADRAKGALCSDEDIAALKVLAPNTASLRVRNAGHSVRRGAPREYRRAFLSFFSGA
jgi:pimeloyl-ACP methyl ester carboxylesterase